MNNLEIRTDEKGITLIELIITSLIISIVAGATISHYTAYRLRAERGNGQACLLELANLQETYFARHNTYSNDLRKLGYKTEKDASCMQTQQYLVSAEEVDTSTCPLSRCYRLNAIPQGKQAADGSLHLSYDASQTDPNLRLKKERGGQSVSGKSWD